MCVCGVCECVCARTRARVCACVHACVRVHVHVCVCARVYMLSWVLTPGALFDLKEALVGFGMLVPMATYHVVLCSLIFIVVMTLPLI